MTGGEIGDNKGKQKHSFLISFVSGGIAGITAKSAVAPLERVKILYQVFSPLPLFSFPFLFILYFLSYVWWHVI